MKFSHDTERGKFIEKNLPLVHSLANRFKGRGIDYEELYSAGCVGLVKACDNFDETRGLKFSTYAVPVIMGEIKRLFRDGGAIKMSRSLKELSLKAARARDELSAFGITPTFSAIAEKLGATEDDIALAFAAAQPPVSLTCGEDGAELSVPSQSGESALIDRLALRQTLETLSPFDKTLIIMRYFRGKTQSETAALLGCTQVSVSRRERKILSELREKLI